MRTSKILIMKKGMYHQETFFSSAKSISSLALCPLNSIVNDTATISQQTNIPNESVMIGKSPYLVVLMKKLLR